MNDCLHLQDLNMESDIFYSHKLYNILMYEHLFYNNGETTWADFLKLKDLGIVFQGFGEYRIQDKKKWLLCKLKYGI